MKTYIALIAVANFLFISNTTGMKQPIPSLRELTLQKLAETLLKPTPFENIEDIKKTFSYLSEVVINIPENETFPLLKEFSSELSTVFAPLALSTIDRLYGLSHKNYEPLISPNGRYITLDSPYEGIFDFNEQKAFTMDKEDDSITFMSFSPQSNFLIYHHTGLIKILDTATKKNVGTLKEYKSTNWYYNLSFTFSPDEAYIVMQEKNEYPLVYSVEEQKFITRFLTKTEYPWKKAHYSPNGRIIAITTEDAVDFFDIHNKTFLGKLNGKRVAFSSDGKYIACVDKSIDFYNTTNLEKLDITIDCENTKDVKIQFSKDSKKIMWFIKKYKSDPEFYAIYDIEKNKTIHSKKNSNTFKSKLSIKKEIIIETSYSEPETHYRCGTSYNKKEIEIKDLDNITLCQKQQLDKFQYPDNFSSDGNYLIATQYGSSTKNVFYHSQNLTKLFTLKRKDSLWNNKFIAPNDAYSIVEENYENILYLLNPFTQFPLTFTQVLGWIIFEYNRKNNIDNTTINKFLKIDCPNLFTIITQAHKINAVIENHNAHKHVKYCNTNSRFIYCKDYLEHYLLDVETDKKFNVFGNESIHEDTLIKHLDKQFKNKIPCLLCEKFDQDIVATCGHAFHETCLKEWLKESNKCPYHARAEKENKGRKYTGFSSKKECIEKHGADVWDAIKFNYCHTKLTDKKRKISETNIEN